MAQRRSRLLATARGDPRQENELAFAQRKLEGNYGKVYCWLGGWRAAVQAGQEVLVWKRPIPAAVLYLVVHGLFYHFATTSDGFLSQLSSLLFWLLVGDAIWRAATRDGQGLDGESNSGSGSRVRRGVVRRREMSGVVAFERALLLSHEQRSCQELVPFEVVCLILAQLWMWVDNIWLALRHWSVNDPLMFSVSLAVPGLVLAVVGKYFSTIVILYVLVMGMVVWPYVHYHDLVQKTSALISTHFPILIQKTVAFWQFIKKLLARDEEALGELSLVRGGGDDDARAREMLGNELNLQIGQGQGQEEGGGRGEEGERGGRGEGGGERRVRQRAVKRVDPGMSVLQDSVLGMHPDAFHDVEDSLASFGPGVGEFPSISNFDQSLLLPQFPPEEDTDHHVTPSLHPPLATIQESEEVSLEDLNPLEDSTELEFGLNPRTISRHRSASHADPTPQRETRPHPLVQYSASAPTAGYGAYSSSQGQPHQEGGRRTPPPPYEAVVSSPGETDCIQAGSYGFEYPAKLDGVVRQRGIPR